MIRSLVAFRHSPRFARVTTVGVSLVALLLGAAASSCSSNDTSGAGGGGTTGATSATKGATNGATSTVVTGSGASVTSTGTGAGFECVGAPLPTTAPAMVLLGGTTTTAGLSGQMPLATVSIELFEGTSTTPAKTATSDAQGLYSVMVATSGAPVDGYVHGTKATYIDSYLYPPAPIAADVSNAKLLLITAGTFNLLQTFASVTQTAGNGFMGIVVNDCNGMPVTGATVSTVPAGTVRYNSGGIPSNTSMVTDTDGVAYVFNVPAGDVTVQASAGGNTLRAHVVNARADVLTTTVVQP